MIVTLQNSRLAGGLLAVMFFLAGCANSRILSEWPETVPQQQVFVQAYQADELNRSRQSDIEYLNWIVRFYEGGELMTTGWNDLTPAVLNDLQGSQLDAAMRKSTRLGMLISAEWAKDNAVRDIDTAMLSLWGSVMLADDDPQVKLAALDLITEDVENLLAGRMTPEEVTEERYVRHLGLDPDF